MNDLQFMALQLIVGLFLTCAIAILIYYQWQKMNIMRIVRVAYRKLNTHFEESRKHDEIRAMASADNDKLIAAYMFKKGSVEFGLKKIQGKGGYHFMYEAVMAYLESHFTINLSSSICTLSTWEADMAIRSGHKQACNYLYELHAMDGEVYYVNIGVRTVTAVDYQGRPIYRGHEHATEIEQVTDMEIIGAPDHRLDDIAEQLSYCQSEFIFYEDLEDSSVRIPLFRIARGVGRGLYLDLMNQTISKLSSKIADLIYEADISVGSKKLRLKGSDLISFISECLSAGENISLFGNYGTGKTSLMKNVQNYLANRKGVRVVMIPPAILEELNTLDGINSLISMLSDKTNGKGEFTHTVLCIDEAELAMAKGKDGLHTNLQTSLLQIMDGDLGQQIGNISVFLIFNADMASLNPALFRTGRMGSTIHLGNIPADRANKAIQSLRYTQLDTTFDEKLYKQKLEGDNRLPDGRTYAVGGEITLADMVGCLVPNAKLNMLDTIVAKYEGRIVKTEPKTGTAAETKTEPKGTKPAPAESKGDEKYMPTSTPTGLRKLGKK